MASLTRTLRLLVIAIAALALTVSAAQAHPIGLTTSKERTNAPSSSSILKAKLHLPISMTKSSVVGSAPARTASDSGFGWAYALIGAALVAALAGLAVSGIRISHRRPVQT